MRLKNILGILGSFIFFISTQVNAADSNYNLPRGVTDISNDIYHLHMTIFYICVAIAVVVFGVLFYSLFKFRKSKGAVAAHFHENTVVEIIWTVIPFLILVIMAVPATKVLFYMRDTGKPDLTIKVTGYQWKWKYDYLDSGISFFSNITTPLDQRNSQAPKGEWYLREVDKPLVLPVGKKIRFLITSNDTIHAWWVPDLGVKKDAIPGFIQETWTYINTAGTYRGQCSVLCGVGHGFMPIVVNAVSENDYHKWVADNTAAQAQLAQSANKTFSKDELLSMGQSHYLNTCAPCHKPDGTGTPPVFPALKGSKTVTGPVQAHIHKVLNGVPGTAMQAFGAQLSDMDIAAIITYERNSWDNDKQGKDAGGIVQPADVAAERGKK